MNFSYNLSEEDLLNWFRHFHASSSAGRLNRSRYITSWSGFYLGVASLVSLYFMTWPAVIGTFGIAIALSVIAPKCYDRTIEKHFAAHAADPKLAGGLGPHQLILTDAGLREISPATDTLIKWTSVAEAVIDGDYVFVRLDTGQAAVISRKSYSGPIPFEQVPEVIDQFKHKHAVE